MSSKSRHDVGRCVDWASHSATELLLTPSVPSYEPCEQRTPVGLMQANLGPTLGPNPWSQIYLPP